MPRLHWEDFSPGQVTECGSRRIARAEIVAFAAEYDPQPMHLDEAAARASLFGGLFWIIASLIGVVIGVIFARIISEFVLLMFRINEHLGAIRQRGQQM